MCFGGGGQDTTVTQTNTPWEGAEGHLTDIYGKMGDVYLPAVWDLMAAQPQFGRDPWQVFSYPYDRVADMTATQKQGMNLTKSLAQDFGNTLQTPADMLMQNLSGYYSDMAMPSVHQAWWGAGEPAVTGEFLKADTNPYIQDYISMATDPIQQAYEQSVVPSLDNQAVASGRYGSGFWEQGRTDAQQQMEKSMMDAATGIAFPTYGMERQLMTEAMDYPMDWYQFERGVQQGSVPNWIDLVNQGFKQAGFLTAAGEAEQAQEQAEIEGEMESWMDTIYGPLDWANVVANMFLSGGALGRTTQQTQPYLGPSLAQSLLGSGSGLAGLLAQLGKL